MDIQRFAYCWFALHTKRRHEQTVASILKNKGYEELLPLCRLCSRAGNGGKHRLQDMRPLYPGYVFCKFDPKIAGPIVTTPGILKIVSFGNIPAVVSDTEIQNIRILVDAEATIHPCPYLAVGERVQLVAGPFKGVEGMLVCLKNRFRVVVSVDILQRSAAVEIDLDWIQPIPGSSRALGGTVSRPTNQSPPRSTTRTSLHTGSAGNFG